MKKNIEIVETQLDIGGNVPRLASEFPKLAGRVRFFPLLLRKEVL
jgi:hypothetical protein